MSDTPRTDEAEEQFWLNKCIEAGDVLTSRAVHSDFARRLELEINQLEWEIRKLKAAKDEGYDEGRIEGHELGYSEGYEKGRVAGYDQAICEGYESGFREGLVFKG